MRRKITLCDGLTRHKPKAESEGDIEQNVKPNQTSNSNPVPVGIWEQPTAFQNRNSQWGAGIRRVRLENTTQLNVLVQVQNLHSPHLLYFHD